MNKRLNAIVLDIDGVILDNSVIFQKILDYKLVRDDMWNFFHANCNGEDTKFIGDNLRPIIGNIPNTVVILSTARNEKCREETEARLDKEFFVYKELYMREDGDRRPSPEVKRDHLLKIMKDYDVILFIDDDSSNCAIAKDLGILALKKV